MGHRIDELDRLSGNSLPFPRTIPLEIKRVCAMVNVEVMMSMSRFTEQDRDKLQC